MVTKNSSMKKIISIAILGLFFIFFGCKKEDAPTVYDCTGLTPTYDLNVKMLMDSHCATAGCHSAGNKADGKDLSTYASTKSVASNSSFLGSIEHRSGFDNMPQNAAKLSDTDIKTIACWVQNGMPQ